MGKTKFCGKDDADRDGWSSNQFQWIPDMVGWDLDELVVEEWGQANEANIYNQTEIAR